MITIQINNITFKVDVLGSEQFEMEGLDSEFRIPIDSWNKFASEFDSENDIPYAFIDKEENLPCFWKQNGKIFTKDTDLFICFLEFCNSSNEKYEIEVETDDISWIFHDYYHSVHHCYNYSIRVGEANERETLLYGLEEAYKFNRHLPEYDYVSELELNFFHRFGKRINDLTDFWEKHEPIVEFEEKDIEETEENSNEI